MHTCSNPYRGRIIRVNRGGLGIIESNLPDKKQYPFTFDKIYGYAGEYPEELKQFGPKGLKEGLAVTFTIDLQDRIVCIHPI